MTGISAYADQNPRALAIRFRPGLMQVPVSLLDQRLVRDGTLAFLKDRGIVIHARSIFLQGLPFLKSSELPPRLRHQSGRFDEIRAGIAGHGLTLIGAFTGFALSHREIDVAIVGVTSIAQMDKFVAATCLNIDALDWAEFAIDDPVVLTPTLWTT